MIMKNLMCITLLLNIYSASANQLDNLKFSKFIKSSYAALIVSIQSKTRVDTEGTCIRVTANVLEGTSEFNSEITFWVTREEDFLDEVKPYLIFIYQAKKYSNRECGETTERFHTLNSVQSMFPLLDRNFCTLDGSCEFLIVRQSIFDNESGFGKSVIGYHLYDVDRIYAMASIGNLREIIEKIKSNVLPAKLQP